MLTKIIKKINDNNTNQFFNDLNTLIPKCETVFDVGGYNGEFAKNLLKKFNKKIRIYIFEPIPEKSQYIKSYFKDNNFNKIKVFNFIIGSKNKDTVFYIGKHKRSSTQRSVNYLSFYYMIKFLLFKTAIERKIIAKQIKLDNFFSKVNQIDLLKIDAEGNELEVLKGCKLLIKAKKIKSIYIEILHHNLYKNYSKKKIEDFLKKDFNLVNSYKTPIIFAEDRFYKIK
jgi:FkbM family methyltransferase